ncbi:MAG: CPXCG motif-containing cysteine-rich protein [Flavobacteriaceae bacterium]
MWEQDYFCPFCAAEVSVLLDPSVAQSSYIEDCEVCCRPLRFEVEFESGTLTFFQVDALEQ